MNLQNKWPTMGELGETLRRSQCIRSYIYMYACKKQSCGNQCCKRLAKLPLPLLIHTQTLVGTCSNGAVSVQRTYCGVDCFASCLIAFRLHVARAASQFGTLQCRASVAL